MKRLSSGFAFVLLFGFVASASGAVVTSGTGPGGVGTVGPTSSLEMWYNADTLGLANNASVSSWTDNSGHTRNATAAGSAQPVYKTGVSGFNGHAVARFDGTDDKLGIASYTFTGNESYFFVHSPTESTTNPIGRGLLGVPGANLLPRGFLIDVVSGSGATDERDRYWASISTGTTDFYTIARQFGVNGAALNANGTRGPLVGYTGGPPRVAANSIVYGQNASAVNGGYVGPAGTNFALGGSSGSAGTYWGDLAEGVVFSVTVNTAQRSIVENYLSSKYDITLTAGDHYAGDTGANGNYDQDVFGIGRTDSTNQHLSAGSAGLGFEATSLTNDQWLLAGNNNLTTVSASQWNRVWYLDASNLTGTETLSLAFDWSDAGVGSFNSAFTNLLYSATNGGPFSSIAVGTYAGDRLNLTGLSSSLFADGYYTIGFIPAPEPSSFILIIFGMTALVRVRRRR